MNQMSYCSRCTMSLRRLMQSCIFPSALLASGIENQPAQPSLVRFEFSNSMYVKAFAYEQCYVEMHIKHFPELDPDFVCFVNSKARHCEPY